MYTAAEHPRPPSMYNTEPRPNSHSHVASPPSGIYNVDGHEESQSLGRPTSRCAQEWNRTTAHMVRGSRRTPRCAARISAQPTHHAREPAHTHTHTPTHTTGHSECTKTVRPESSSLRPLLRRCAAPPAASRGQVTTRAEGARNSTFQGVHSARVQDCGAPGAATSSNRPSSSRTQMSTSDVHVAAHLGPRGPVVGPLELGAREPAAILAEAASVPPDELL